MGQVQKRLPTIAALSVTAAMLALPPIAMADDGTASPVGGAEVAGGTEGGAATTPATGTPDANPIGEAIGSFVKVIFGDGRAGAPTQQPVGITEPKRVASVPAPAAPAAPAAAAESPAVMVADSAAPARLAAAPNPAAPPPADPWKDLWNWWNGCTCQHQPPPPPPPPPPPDDKPGLGLPIFVPPVPGIPRNKPGCGPYVPGLAVTPGIMLPPAPPVGVVPVGPVPLIGGGGGGGGGGGAPGGGGGPVALSSGGTYTPTSYEGGLTFLTGVDDDRQPNEIPIVVSAVLVAVGSGYIFWRRNVERSAGRHRRVSGPHRHVDGVRG